MFRYNDEQDGDTQNSHTGRDTDITRQLHTVWSLCEHLTRAWKIREGFREELTCKLRSDDKLQVIQLRGSKKVFQLENMEKEHGMSGQPGSIEHERQELKLKI